MTGQATAGGKAPRSVALAPLDRPWQALLGDRDRADSFEVVGLRLGAYVAMIAGQSGAPDCR